MSVTTTVLGPNTTQITMSGETGPSNFITALDTAITGAGWSQVDVSNQYYRVYSAPNLDGVTAKIIAIQIEPVYMRIYTTSFETWNSTTHTGTNQVWDYNRAGWMGFAYSSCDVIVMASPRWLVLQSFIFNQASVWSGVFEIMREPNEDTTTAGYPCWCWTSSCLLYLTVPTSATTTTSVSLPRTSSGLTGQAAAINNNLILSTYRLGLPGTSSNYQAGTALTQQTDAWSSNNLVHAPRVVVNGTELHGRIIGLKFAYNTIGSQYNVASMVVDGNYNYSASGSAKNFWVLYGHPVSNVQNILNTSSTGTGYTTVQSTAVANARYCVAASTGFYCSTTSGSGVYFVGYNGTTLSSAVQIATGGSTTIGLAYDNVQYVYAATAAGVYQVNTSTNTAAVISGTSTYTTGQVCYDGTYLWAASTVSATTIPIYRINVSGPTVSTFNITPATAGTVCAMCSDGSNLYVAVTSGVIFKITSSGTVSTFVSTGFGAIALYYNGQNIFIVTVVNGTANFYFLEYNLSGTLVFDTPILGQSITIVSPWYKMDFNKIGVFDSISYNSGNDYIMVTGVYAGLINNTTIGYTASNGVQIYNNFICDGNRAFGVTSSNFYLYTNFFKPDETTTTYGRLLLPQ